MSGRIVKAQGSQAGLRVGADFSKISESDNSITSAMLGPTAGFALGHQFSRSVALETSFSYNERAVHLLYYWDGPIQKAYGGRYPGIERDTSNIRIAYLEIPLILKYSLGDNVFQPYALVGPSVGLLLSASEQYRAITLNGSPSTGARDASGDFNTVDISVLVGLGISYGKLGETSYFVDAGYALGLSDLYRSAGARTTDIRLSCGALFPL